MGDGWAWGTKYIKWGAETGMQGMCGWIGWLSSIVSLTKFEDGIHEPIKRLCNSSEVYRLVCKACVCEYKNLIASCPWCRLSWIMGDTAGEKYVEEKRSEEEQILIRLSLNNCIKMIYYL